MSFLLSHILMLIEDHWLTGAKRIESPNFDERPHSNDISLIVIHGISLPPGEFGHPYVEHLFCNRLDPSIHPYFEGIYQLKVSAHLFIDRAGEIAQFVPLDKRAWHAGASSYRGRERCNDYSIGIELEGDGTSPYTEAQYRQLSEVVKSLLQYYPTLSPQRIVGHSDIAPGRKTDPGASFDWKQLEHLLEM